MAKCDLSIELDHPERIYLGGETITGTVHVDVEADVPCKGLDVSCGWRTHGRGNVDHVHQETVTVFAGKWTAGQRESYRFELTTGDWPPSYHGHYINVDHYIDAVAKIPWAFDPKASQAFVMRPAYGPADTPASQASAIGSCVGSFFSVFVIGMILFGLSMAVFALMTNALAGTIALCVIIPIALLVAAGLFLPKWLLGKVDAELITPVVAPGQRLRARLAFQPRRPVRLNAITAELVGQEVCVSGSGSNRRTHRKIFFNETQTLLGPTTLQPDDRQAFDLEFPLPEDVPHSFELGDNTLTWTLELRVDIPRWPDWKQTLALQIFPDGEPRSPESDFQAARSVASRPFERSANESRSAGVGGRPDRNAEATAGRPAGADGDDSEITFEETVQYLYDSRDDPEQMEVLLKAIRGLSFNLSAVIERRLLYSGDEDPHVYRDGYAVWARHQDPAMPLVLYIPHELADEFEQAGGDPWAFRGTVVGWDHGHRRLQIKVLVG